MPLAGPRTAVGSASDSYTRSGHMFSFLLPLNTQEGQFSVTGECMCTQYLLTACPGILRLGLTDRSDKTTSVHRGRKATKQQQQQRQRQKQQQQQATPHTPLDSSPDIKMMKMAACFRDLCLTTNIFSKVPAIVKMKPTRPTHCKAWTTEYQLGAEMQDVEIVVNVKV